MMNLKILLPYGVFTENNDVTRIVLETVSGSYGFWPNRLDCIAALVPGILTYQTISEGVVYTAIDEGVVIKSGLDVKISVRKAIRGKELGKLREALESDIMNLEDRERHVRSVLAKLESGFIRNFQKVITNERST